MVPILFAPIYKEIIWGGTRLAAQYGRTLPSDTVGESWDVSCRAAEMSVAENGAWSGKTLGELIAADRAGILGTALCGEESFPLLVKIIDARDNLSVQVHPGDAFARVHENVPFGKTEMWYVLDAPKDAALIIGLRDSVTEESFRAAIHNGAVEDCLGRLPIKRGDVIFIAAGLIHAITAGVMLAEIQQNSDTTYRLYDYNRLGFDGKPRPLHVEKSIAVTDFRGKLRKTTVPGLSIQRPGADITYYIACPYFAFEKIALHGSLQDSTDNERFLLFMCTEGVAAIQTSDGRLILEAGRTAFFPASLGAYALDGTATLLKSYVPNIQRNFMQPLLDAGYSMAQIAASTAVEGA